MTLAVEPPPNARTIGVPDLSAELLRLIQARDEYLALRSRLEKLAEEYECAAVDTLVNQEGHEDAAFHARRLRECLEGPK
jgi:hypothetical protein